MRAFDPAMLESVDDCTIEADEISFAEQCPACGKPELVWENEQLVDLDGNPHVCDDPHPG